MCPLFNHCLQGPIPVPPVHVSSGNTPVPHDFYLLSVLRSFSKASACDPSGLRIQHLLDATQVPISTSICTSNREVVNILAYGQAPVEVAKYLAGGSLIALVKDKPNCPPDVKGKHWDVSQANVCASSQSLRQLITWGISNSIMESLAWMAQRQPSAVSVNVLKFTGTMTILWYWK